MNEVYRLIFRGEVLKGQHPSVVRKRLAKSLKLDDARTEKLFAGAAVVLKRDADVKTAARFQALFKEAGARLRVQPVEAADTSEAPTSQRPATDTASSSDDKSTPETHVVPDPVPAELSESQVDSSTFKVLPPGSQFLTDTERKPQVVSDVNTDHLSVGDVGSDLGTGSESNSGDVPAAPEISHLSVAEAGVDLHENDEADRTTEIFVPVVDFEVADVGSDVGSQGADRQSELVEEIDVREYDLAAVGEDIGRSEGKIAPPAPDTSHLSLEVS